MAVGDIVLTPYPFTDLSENKLRPAVVLVDVRYTGEADWIVCEITSQVRPDVRQIALFGSDRISAGLRYDSRVLPDRLFTLNESVFERTLGRLTPAKTAEILAAVRSLF